MNRQPATAVLLAAGRGKRQRPYTDHMPKPLLAVDGRPTLDYVLTAAANAGISQVCLVTHYRSEQILRYVGDGSRWGVQAFFCRQEQLRGTADALRSAMESQPELFSTERPFVLTATDYVLPVDYLANLVAAHLAAGTDMTFSLKRLPLEQMPASSCARFLDNGQIGEIIEKPAPGQITGPLAVSLTFVLSGAIGGYLKSMRPSARGEFELQGVINQMLDAGFSAGGLEQAVPREWSADNWPTQVTSQAA